MATVFTGFSGTSRGCGRKFRISARMLEEMNKVDQKVYGEKVTLEESAMGFDYCYQCASGEVLPGEYVA